MPRISLLPAALALVLSGVASASMCDVTSLEDCAVIRLVNRTGDLVHRTFVQGNPGPGLRPDAWEDVVLQPEAGRIGIDWFHDHVEIARPMEQYHGWASGVDACVIVVVTLLPGGNIAAGGTIPKECRRSRLAREAAKAAQAQREAEESARLARDAAERARREKAASAKAQGDGGAAAPQVGVPPPGAHPRPVDEAAIRKQRAAEEAAAKARESRQRQEEAARVQREAFRKEQERQSAEAARVQAEANRRVQFSQDMLASEADRNERSLGEMEAAANAAERRDRIQAAAANAKARAAWKAPVTSAGIAGALDLSDLKRVETPTRTPAAGAVAKTDREN